MMSDYLDSLLNEQEEKQLFDHVKGCESCRQDFEAMREYMSAVTGLERKNAPSDLKELILSNLIETKQSSFPVYSRKWYSYLAVAAVLLLFVYILLPGSLFSPVLIQTEYQGTFGKRDKKGEKGEATGEMKDGIQQGKIIELKSIVESLDGEFSEITDKNMRGDQKFFRIEFKKSDYPEFRKEAESTLRGINLPDDLPFSFNRMIIVELKFED